MSYNFSGKRALVTGAGKGIGRETVKALVSCGAHVVALSRTQSDLDSLVHEVNNVTPLCADVCDTTSLVKKVDELGPFDYLVNNAGISYLESFLEVTEEKFDSVMNINVKAVLFLSQAVAKRMVERGVGGAIVNVSSVASQVALKDHTVYCTSKAALDMLTKMMGMELGQHKIRVNAVNPTVVMTTMGKMAWSDPAKATPVLNRIPAGRFVEESEVTDSILFLLSEKSAMINCSTLMVDGGYHTLS